MALDDDTLLVRNEAIPSGEVDEEMVALDLEKGSCFGMDRVGSKIWELAAEPVSLRQIAEVLTSSYDVEQEQCLADVRPFVEDLLAEGLLRRS